MSITTDILPEVQTLPATTTVKEAVAALKLAGGVIIKNIMSSSSIAQIESEIRPHLDADIPWEGDFFPPETRRAYRLISKSHTAAMELPLNPLFTGVTKAFLEERFWAWTGDKKNESVSKPQLNNSIAFSIGPGAKKQPLHRDDMTHLVRNARVDVYPTDAGQSRRDTAVGFFVAGKPTTRENGATRFIPGSHLWEHEREPKEELAIYAELEPGDGLFILASVYHGGSANTTKDQERLVYSCFMTRGYLRQEENQYLSHSIEQVKRWPVELQQVAGYQLSEPFCGWVDSKDPRCVLDSSVKTISA